MENPNRPDCEDLEFANKPRTVSWRTEKMPKKNKRGRWFTVHWSAHPEEEQSEVANVTSAWIDYKKIYDIVAQSRTK